jgi:hypothetical protein
LADFSQVENREPQAQQNFCRFSLTKFHFVIQYSCKKVRPDVCRGVFVFGATRAYGVAGLPPAGGHGMPCAYKEKGDAPFVR